MAFSIGTTFTQTGSGDLTATIPAGTGRIGIYKLTFIYTTVSPPTFAPTCGGNAMTIVTGSPATRDVGGGSSLAIYTYYILDANFPGTGAQTIARVTTGGAGLTGWHQSFTTLIECPTQAAPTMVSNTAASGTTLRLPSASTTAIPANTGGIAFRSSTPGITSTVAGDVGTWTEVYDENGSGGGDTTNAGATMTNTTALNEFVTFTMSGSANHVGMLVVPAAAAAGVGGWLVGGKLVGGLLGGRRLTR